MAAVDLDLSRHQLGPRWAVAVAGVAVAAATLVVARLPDPVPGPWWA